MSKIRTTVVKFPVDVLQYLQREYPNSTNAERVRRLYESHIEVKELKNKMFNIGSFVYGKNVWKKKFK